MSLSLELERIPESLIHNTFLGPTKSGHKILHNVRPSVVSKDALSKVWFSKELLMHQLA